MAAVGVTASAKRALARLAEYGVPRVFPRLVRILPHDEESFTQGLAWHAGRLYESTGLVGRSTLREIDPDTGTVLRRIPVDVHHAEGIAIADGRLYQLTWRSGKAIIYRVPDLVRLGEVEYTGEGWGLAAGPDGLIMSDGSSVLQFRDSAFACRRCIRVKSHGISVRDVNDIEWAEARIFANILASTDVLEIDATSGRVERIIDCSGLFALAQPTGHEHVLNGIAFDPQKRTFFLTGKCWRYIFEVQFPLGQ